MNEAISLTFELTQLQRALFAAEILCQRLAEEPFAPNGAVAPARSAIAVIGLVEARLRLLQSVVCEELDPKVLLMPWNSVPEAPVEGDDPDLRLQPWTVAERLRHARSTVERLERRLEWDS